MKEVSLPFVIESEEVNRLCKASGLTLEAFLATLVEPTRTLARPPISRFHVGAVGLGSSGRVFRGVNIEFAGLPLSFSIHAEQFLVANAARNGEHRLQFLAVSAAPCGHCRQFLQELRGAGDIRVFIADGRSDAQPLAHFLPDRFGPEDLLEEDFPLLLETQANDLCFPSPDTVRLHESVPAGDSVSSKAWPSPDDDLDLTRLSEGNVLDPPGQQINGTHLADDFSENEQGLKSADKILATLPNFVARNLDNAPAAFSCKFPPKVPSTEQNLVHHQSDQIQQAALDAEQLIQLRDASLEAANSSYAPYTNSPSGVAILTKQGDIYKGPYFESAAYNPSLPPLQAAIVAFVAEGGGNFEEVTEVVLVEKKGAAVIQAPFVRLAMEQISPKAGFHVFEAQTC